MRKLLLTGVAVVAVVAASSAVAVNSAAAADMPLKAAPPVAVAPNWTGFYIGLNGGGGWGTKELWEGECLSCDPFSGKELAQNSVNGFLAGGQIGYNQQYGWVVLSIQGSFDWANIRGTTPIPIFSTLDQFSSQTDGIFTLTGRIGGTVDHALLYVIGGAAWALDKYNLLEFGTPFASGSETRLGGLLGGGIEYAFTPNWSGKLEYNFMDFGGKNVTFCEGTECGTFGVRQFIHTVTVGVNYKFNDWHW